MYLKRMILRLRPGVARLHLFPATAVLFLTGLCLAAVPVRAASFTASLDRDTITLGEQATLSLAFEGGQSKNVPAPDVPGLQITQTGTAQSVNIINGAMTSTVTVTFAMTARQAGEFTIPAFTADVNGQQLSTEPLKLTVVKAGAPSASSINSGSEMAFLKLSIPAKKVYVGQVLTAQLQICLRGDVQNFGNFQFTGTPASGFSVGKMNQGQNQRAQIGNRVYTVIPLTFTLTAVQSGLLSVGPFPDSATLVLPSANQGGDPIFRQFFNSGEQKQVSLVTETFNVQSLPLPDQNVPANFNGAVGNYTLAVTAGPTNVAAGDPITVRVQISGRGAWDAVTLPDQPAWHDFKTYPPTARVETTDQLGIEGKKTFEQIVTPQNTDVRELPSFSFSYFDPGAGTYRTLVQPATPLVVHSGGTADAGPAPQPPRPGNPNPTENPPI